MAKAASRRDFLQRALTAGLALTIVACEAAQTQPAGGRASLYSHSSKVRRGNHGGKN